MLEFKENIIIPKDEEIKKVLLWLNNRCILMCSCNTNTCKYCKAKLAIIETLEIFGDFEK